MSFPTKPAFVVDAKDWDKNLLAHPMMKFMYLHEQDFDAKNRDHCRNYYCDDMAYTKTTDEVFYGQDGLRQFYIDYDIFDSYFHEPVYGVITVTEDGYHLCGYAKLFANLIGAEAEKKCENLRGRKWECIGQGAFRFTVVWDETREMGMKFKDWQVYTDPTPMLNVAKKMGIIRN